MPASPTVTIPITTVAMDSPHEQLTVLLGPGRDRLVLTGDGMATLYVNGGPHTGQPLISVNILAVLHGSLAALSSAPGA